MRDRFFFFGTLASYSLFILLCSCVLGEAGSTDLNSFLEADLHGGVTIPSKFIALLLFAVNCVPLLASLVLASVLSGGFVAYGRAEFMALTYGGFILLIPPWWYAVAGLVVRLHYPGRKREDPAVVIEPLAKKMPGREDGRET